MGKNVQDMIAAELTELAAHSQVTVNDDGTKTVTLITPVEIGSKTYDKLTFRLPIGRDWRETDKEEGDVGKGFRLAASLADVPMVVLDKMDGDDALLCSRVAGTLGKKSQTGGKL